MSISKLANFGTITRLFEKKSVESLVCLSEINYKRRFLQQVLFSLIHVGTVYLPIIVMHLIKWLLFFPTYQKKQ